MNELKTNTKGVFIIAKPLLKSGFAYFFLKI